MGATAVASGLVAKAFLAADAADVHPHWRPLKQYVHSVDAPAPTTTSAHPRRRAPRRRGAGRPAARRLSVVRGGDSGDSDSDPEPPQARAKPRAIFFYGCSVCPHCGNVLGYYEGRLWCPTRGCKWGGE